MKRQRPITGSGKVKIETSAIFLAIPRTSDNTHRITSDNTEVPTQKHYRTTHPRPGL